MVHVRGLCKGEGLPRCGGGIHLPTRDASFPYFRLDLRLQLLLTLRGDCNTALSDTLEPYHQITTLWACTHVGQSNKSCRLPTSLRRRQLRSWPAALPWLISTTESQVAPPYTQLCSLQCSSAQTDQLTDWQSPPGWLLREAAALWIHVERLESSHLPALCSHHGPPGLRELAGNNNAICFSLTFPNWRWGGSSGATGRSREGHCIFICHKLCLGEH